jgi:hypothetical protein
MYLDLTFLTVNALALAVCGMALWKGERPERLAGGLVLFSMFPAVVLIALPKSIFPMAELVGDGLAARGLLVLLMIYGRLWLGAVMLFQSAQFALHSFYLVAERKHDLLHAVVNNVDFLGTMLTMAVATGMAMWRRAKARAIAADSAA